MPDDCVKKWDWSLKNFLKKRNFSNFDPETWILEFFFQTTKIGQILTFDITTCGPKNSKWLIFSPWIIKKMHRKTVPENLKFSATTSLKVTNQPLGGIAGPRYFFYILIIIIKNWHIESDLKCQSLSLFKKLFCILNASLSICVNQRIKEENIKSKSLFQP